MIVKIFIEIGVLLCGPIIIFIILF